MIPANIPFLEVSGTPYSRGWTVGNIFSKQIRNVLRDQEEFLYHRKDDNIHPKRVDFLTNYANQHFPELMEEIRGMAEAANESFRDLLIHNFRHSFFHQDHCSSVIIRDESHIFLGHNEDCSLPIAQNSYIVLYDMGQGTKFLAYTYAGSLAGNAWGFNNYGMVFSCNYLKSKNIQLGCPRLFLDRKLMEAKNLAEALSIIQSHTPRAGVFSYNMISRSEMKAVNVETDTTAISVTEIDERFVHTNHYVHPQFANDSEKGLWSESSLRRYTKAKEILPQCTISTEGARNLLWDPKIRCLEDDIQKNDGLMTVNTPIFSITKDGVDLEVFNIHSSEKPCFKCSQHIFN